MKKIIALLMFGFVMATMSVCFAEQTAETQTAQLMSYSHRGMVLARADTQDWIVIQIFMYDGLVADGDTIRGNYENWFKQIFVDETTDAKFSGSIANITKSAKEAYQLFDLISSGRFNSIT